jgi:transcriptional regulator with XRE-family HTH domain
LARLQSEVSGDQPKPSLTISGLTPECVAMDGFSERLRATRERRGLSQVRFAEMLGVLPRVYNRWEKGGATPRFDTVAKMAEILSVSLDELAGRQPPTSDIRIHDPRLHELYKEIDRLSAEDQQALAILLDSLVKRSQMARLLAS